jgi:hypothetical protein
MHVNRLSDNPTLRRLVRPCWPKEQCASEGAARAQMHSLEKRDLHKNTTCHTYRCPHCKTWHVGHHVQEVSHGTR